ncbi:unnamed protein product [Prunus armeniaca]
MAVEKVLGGRRWTAPCQGCREMERKAASWHAKNSSPSRKKPKSHFVEKSQVPTYKLDNHDLLREIVRACSSSTEHQRDADISLRTVKSRAVKCGVDSVSLTPLEVRLAEAKKMRESSARAKGSSLASGVDPKANKSNLVRDACVFDLLKTNIISNPSSCAELLSELKKKNAELASKLSADQARYEKKTSDLRAMISKLKSSLTEKDSELNSSAADLASQKDVFFRLECNNFDISLSCTVQMGLLPCMRLMT